MSVTIVSSRRLWIIIVISRKTIKASFTGNKKKGPCHRWMLGNEVWPQIKADTFGAFKKKKRSWKPVSHCRALHLSDALWCWGNSFAVSSSKQKKTPTPCLFSPLLLPSVFSHSLQRGPFAAVTFHLWGLSRRKEKRPDERGRGRKMEQWVGNGRVIGEWFVRIILSDWKSVSPLRRGLSQSYLALAWPLCPLCFLLMPIKAQDWL